MQFMTTEEKLVFNKLTASLHKASEAEEPADSASQKTDEPPPRHETHEPPARHNLSYDMIDALEQTKYSTSYRHLKSNRPIIGHIISLTKKAIRKLLFWYVEPSFERQTIFNNNVTALLSQQSNINNALNDLNYQQHNINNEQYSINNEMYHFKDIQHKINVRNDNSSNAQHDINKKHEIEISQQNRQINELQQAFRDLIEEMRNSRDEIKNNHSEQLSEVRRIQRVSDDQIVDVQNKLNQLKKFDLDIFAEPKTFWDIGSFAQAGEDMVTFFILQALGIPISEASYIDLGANLAKEYSNTYHFYRQGARGLLVEANPTLIPHLKFYRSGDMVLNRCVAGQSGDFVDFYVVGYGGAGLSTTDKARAEEYVEGNPNLVIDEVISVETIDFNDIIDNHFGKVPTILNIDIEGMEMEILRTIDFEKHRPLLIILETIPHTLPFKITCKNMEIAGFMDSKDYYEYAFTGVNTIFLDRRYLVANERIVE